MIAGDHPDPTIVRVGDDFYSLVTSGGWEPEFPILHSKDLVNWENAGAVFQEKPAWARGDFWAPEISEYKGQYYVYYAARKKDGPLCVAVATALAPLGPWTDHGPLVCQEDGSIDAFAGVDEDGDRVLFWKEDGNSRNQPTPIWAQRLSSDGTKLIGEKKEMIRNDVPWEKKVVEGEFILRHGGYFYMFYAGAACCGLECDYAIGVARAQKLMGPWEKFAENPILAGNEHWRCPGHGSIVQDKQGREYFIFHSYENKRFQLGRQAVLEQIEWRDDGWPRIRATGGVNDWAPSPFQVAQQRPAFADDFQNGALKPGWEWPNGRKPVLRAGSNGLVMSPTAAQQRGEFGGLITRRIRSTEFVANTKLMPKQSKGEAGMTVFGDRSLSIGIGVDGKKIFAWRVQNGKKTVMYSITRTWDTVQLRIAERGGSFHLEVSGGGEHWEPLGAALPDYFGQGWDGAMRIGLYVAAGDSKAEFGGFRMNEVVSKASGAPLPRSK